MAEKHLNWARSHDWGRQAELIDGEIRFNHEGESLSFRTFQELKNWAGY